MTANKQLARMWKEVPVVLLYGNLPSACWMDWGKPQWPSVKTMEHF